MFAPALTPAAEYALERTFERAMEAAGTALAEMSGQEIQVVATKVARTTGSQVLDSVGGAGTLVVCIYLGITGSLSGHAMLALRPAGARKLAALLLEGFAVPTPAQQDSIEFDELEISALQEVGNVTIGAFLNEVGRHLDEPVHPTVPVAVSDMAGPILDGVLADLTMESDDLLAAHTMFISGGETIQGSVLVMPHRGSLDILTAALGAS
jgi:chemotaxis protein CheC